VNHLQVWAACSVIALTGVSECGAQWNPTKPIRIVVGFPPGGGADAVPRLLAPGLGQSLGQPVVVDNRPGASGNIGAEVVARAGPDGYTLLNAPITHAINISLYSKLAYDPVTDFAPITVTTSSVNVLVTHPSLPVKNVKELITLARARPGQIAFGSGSVGTTHHLSGELFNSLAKTQMLHIPYKGGGPAIINLLGGHIQIMFASTPEVRAHIQTGRLRALAVTSASRWPLWPEMPTVSESGLSGFEVVGWLALMAPASTPKNIVARINAEVVKTLRAADVKERINGIGFVEVANSPEEAALHIKSEIAKWSAVIKASGAKAE
jgi:tripartite-type tricarboxylate transporter receptor subunit TctC